jgi:hypothetical protein
MLHIHNGDSTAVTAKKAVLPGEHFAWREALVCGPAPQGLSEEEFCRVRATHLASAYGVSNEKSASESFPVLIIFTDSDSWTSSSWRRFFHNEVTFHSRKCSSGQTRGAPILRRTQLIWYLC